MGLCYTCDGDGYIVEGSQAQAVLGCGTRVTCPDCDGTGKDD